SRSGHRRYVVDHVRFQVTAFQSSSGRGQQTFWRYGLRHYNTTQCKIERSPELWGKHYKIRCKQQVRHKLSEFCQRGIEEKQGKGVMAKATKKQALDRGLSALLKEPNNDIQSATDKNADKVVGHIVELELDAIEVNPFQPRSNFNDEALLELASSIRELGVIQP